MVGNVGDVFRVLLDSQRFGIVGDLCDLSLLLLEVCVVFDVGLNFGVFRYPLRFRRFRDCGSFGFWDVCFAVWKFVETFVCFHVQCHCALGTFEACFVPCLIQAFELLDGIDHLLTPGAGFIHFDSSAVVVVVFVDQARRSPIYLYRSSSSSSKFLRTPLSTLTTQKLPRKGLHKSRNSTFFDYVSTWLFFFPAALLHFGARATNKFLFR